jgi:hypothetical protein
LISWASSSRRGRKFARVGNWAGLSAKTPVDLIQPRNRDPKDIEDENREIDCGRPIAAAPFKRPGIAHDRPAHLHHSSDATDSTMQSGIFENGRERISVSVTEGRAPAEDSVIAEREAKHLYP